MMMAAGTCIKRVREEKGISRYRLAKDSGISYSHLTAIEDNKHSPSLEVVRKIASGLGVTVSELLREIDKTSIVND